MKKIIFLSLPTVIFFTIAELLSLAISPKSSVFWNNPMMLQYPVERFDQNITRERINFNNDPNRLTRYIPDHTRWYRLYPEPAIPEDGKLILNFGDSSTWGWGLADRANAYSGALTQHLPDSIHSINLGVPGYSSLQGLKYLEEMLGLCRARVIAVTLYFGNNDCVENGGTDSAKLRAVGKSGALQIINGWLEQHSAFYRVLRGIAADLHGEDNILPRVSPEEYRQNMKRMIEICNRQGIKVVLIQPPIHYTWRPGNLTYVRSLKRDIKNRSVISELAISENFYNKGLNLLYGNNDSCEAYLKEAIEHDWIMSRLKKDWLSQLATLAGEGTPIVQVNPLFFGAEHPYCFEDYCHPSAYLHSQIARGIAERLKTMSD